MADGRMLKRVITRSQKLAALKSDKARLLWFYMLPYTDVEGRIEADPDDIREDIIRRQRHGYTLEVVDDCLKDLHRVRLIRLYEVDSRPYLCFARFHDEQKIRRDREAESKIPGPVPDEYRTTPPKAKSSQVKSSPSSSKVKLSKAKPSLSKEKPKVGIDKNSLEKGGLELEKEIKTTGLRFIEGLEQTFASISKDEATTFSRIAVYLSDLVRRSQVGIEIFGKALEWAEDATTRGAKNPKGLFVAKVKQETGFRGRGKLLE